MSEISATSGGSRFAAALTCRCGAELPGRDVPWGCTDCGSDCCRACAFWLESTVYCLDCTDRILAA